MITIGLFFTILLGWMLLRVIGRFSWIETIGLSFLVGLGIQTMLMLFINTIGFRMGRMPVLLVTALAIIVLYSVDVFRNRSRLSEWKRPCFQWPRISLTALIFIGLIGWFEYMNLSKCLYFPTFDRDSLAAFDTIGWIMAQEQTVRGLSIFQGDYMPGIHHPGSTITYSPMVQLSYAYVYLLSAETSKCIPGLVFLFFLVAFFAAVQRVSGTTAAAIFTFFMMITPELIAFSSHSMTNVIHAVYASLAVIYLTLWLRGRERKDLILGALLLGINVWCRSEGIVFIGASLLVLFSDALRRKQYRPFWTVTIIAMFPIVYWVAFMKLFGLYAESVVITYPFWDGDKAYKIWFYLKHHFMNLRFYGYSFLIFVIAIGMNLPGVLRRRVPFYLPLIFLFSILFYAVVIYQIEYKWDRIENVLAHSAKRFLFCFVPMAWYYVASNPLVSKAMNRLDEYMCSRKTTVGSEK